MSTLPTAADAADAYVYAYPMVLMEISMRQLTAVPAPVGTKAPVGQFAHLRAFPDDTFEAVVSPNADTLYSSCFFDVSDEPLVLSLPDTKGRYYLMPMLDFWTNVFASPGARTTGTHAGDFAIVGPNWHGELPAGVQRIDAPTSKGWILGRTQANGKDDFAFVNSLQDQMKLTPLGAWGTDYTPPAQVAVDQTVDTTTAPVDQVANMSAETFWTMFASLLGDNPPAAADKPMVERLGQMGIEAGSPLTWDSLSAAQRDLLDQATAQGLAAVEAAGKTPPVEIKNTWLMAYKIGSYGTNYLLRAGVAWVGLGANLPADAIYPMTRVDSEGQPLDGANRYILHFAPGELPPVDGFWSLTMYNNRQFFVRNPLSRFAIGDRNPLTLNSDGSLDLYIQHESPGPEKESNWLPAPADGFNLMLRLYWPKQAVLDGTWIPPVVTRVTD